MRKKLQPGDRYNKFQEKKKEFNNDKKAEPSKQKIAIMGLVQTMSGARKVVQSALEGKSESALTSALMNTNEEAAKREGDKKKK